MTEQRMPLEGRIAGWMADEAAGAPDAFLEQVLAATATTSPRPRLVALLAEPTLRSGTTKAAVGLPSRALVLAAVLGLLLAAIAGLAIGAYLLLNQAPAETADWPGFRGAADRQGAHLTGPVGNPVTAWQIQSTGAVLEIAVVGDRAFFGSDDGRVHAVSRDRGIELWSVEVAEPPLVGPFASDGRLYVSDQAGTFHAISQADGSSVWTSPQPYAGPSRSVAAAGQLFFGTADGFVVALDAATGAERWRVRVPGATAVGAPATADGRVFAGSAGGGFVAIDVATHAIAWTADTGTEITGSATVADGIAYIGAGTDEAGSGSLHAYDAVTGRPLWTASDPRLSLPTVADGVAYSSSVDGRLEALDTATGAARWSVQLEGDTRSPVVVAGVVYLSGGAADRVYAIEASTGRELWQAPLDGAANCCVSVAKGLLYVGTLNGTVTAIGGDGATIAAHAVPSIGGGSSRPGPSPASPAPSPSTIPIAGVVTWTVDLRAMAFAPISQITIDPQGRIWAPEAAGNTIAIFSPDGQLLEEWGRGGDGPGEFDFTRGNGDGYGTLAFRKDGSFYVLDVGNVRIQQFDRDRHFVRAWGQFGTRPKEYEDPVGIAVAPDGTLWVLDDRRSIVEHYTADGKVLGGFDPFERLPVNDGANSLAVDSAGNLYVSGAGPNIVSVFDPSGRFLREIGREVFTEQATDMAIDPAGRVFVTQGAERGDRPGVLVFDPGAALVGGFGPEGTGDGQVLFPAGIALDGAGNLYVEDSIPESARLMKIHLAPLFGP